MNNDNEIMPKIQELAGLFLSIDEIVILLDLDRKEFISQIKQKKGAMYHSWLLGKTLSKKEIHENIIKMAKKGSPAAEDTANKMLANMELDTRDSC